jgi:cytohesin
LHWAAFGGYKEIVELLIAKGADVNARTKRDGDTPLDWVIKFKHPKTADLLRKHGGKAKTPDISIHEAARQGKIEVVKQHLTDGADVNAKLGGGSTPLFLAALEGHREVAELLIENGADVNAKGFGTTPLDMAYDSAELAALLRKHGGKTRKELQAAGN